MNPQTSPLALIKKYGTSYYRASLRFPKAKRAEIFTLYKFVRLPDQIIDTPGVDKQQAKQQLEQERNIRSQVYQTKEFWHKTYGNICQLFYTYSIPFEYSQAFWDAMLADCSVNRYQTYQQLEEYMYGSAAVVWLMMNRILWCPPAADYCAQKLWEAMQLTNFLRDIKEDYLDLDRIYIPQNILHYYQLSITDIDKYSHQYAKDQRRIACIHHLTSTAQKLYKEASHWYHFIPSQYRKAIIAASLLYQGILKNIIHYKYDVFTTSCKTTKWQKAHILLSFITKRKKNR